MIPLATLSDRNRAAYALRTQPPPWLSPTPAPVAQDEPLDLVMPAGLSAHPSAVWPRLYAILEALARVGRSLPYLTDLPRLVGAGADTLSVALQYLDEHGMIVRERQPRRNRPWEIRITITATGAVVQTAGWRA